MTQTSPMPEPQPREPTNEELAQAELLEQQYQAPQVSYGPVSGQVLEPYLPAGPPRPSQHRFGPSGFVPTPVFRYREGRDSPGCMIGMAIPAALMTVFFIFGNLTGTNNALTWSLLAMIASATIALVVGAFVAAKRNEQRRRDGR